MNSNVQTIAASPSEYRRGLHRFAIFLTVWTFFVVTLGGVVKSNEAGLSIPEGFILSWLPDWWERPNLRLEFAHRMIVGVLGMGVFAMMFWTLKVEARSFVKKFSVALAVIVVIQAVFGYMTVRFFAHWHTSIPHVALGHIFLSSMACFATVLSPAWTGATPVQVESEEPSLRRLARANLIMMFIQLLLGAAIRHDDHGKALVDERDAIFYWHLGAHIVGALAVSYFLARVLMRVFRDHRGQAEIIGPAKKAMMLLGLQFLLGPAAAVLKVIYSRESLDADGPPAIRAWVATAHVVVGALVLTYSAVLYARAKRYVSPMAVASTNSAAVARASA